MRNKNSKTISICNNAKKYPPIKHLEIFLTKDVKISSERYKILFRELNLILLRWQFSTN